MRSLNHADIYIAKSTAQTNMCGDQRIHGSISIRVKNKDNEYVVVIAGSLWEEKARNGQIDNMVGQHQTLDTAVHLRSRRHNSWQDQWRRVVTRQSSGAPQS